MHLLSALFPLIVLPALVSSARSNSGTQKPTNAILLSKVESLTFTASALTSARRSRPIQQLTCAGPACRHHTLSSLRCTNAGSGYDSEDIQWTCTASLPEAFKLGSTDVSCEGYDHPEDAYVLRGSCGVTYRLLFTEKGEREYADQLRRNPGYDREDNTLATYLFLCLFAGVLAWIVYSAWKRARESRVGREAPRTRRPRGWGGGGHGGDGGGGGGGGGGWRGSSDDWDSEPPPPYTPRQSPQQKRASSSAQAHRGGGGGGWGLGNRGFWTGLAGGAAAGYAAGATSSSRRARNGPTDRNGQGGGGSHGSSSESGSLGASSSSGRSYNSTGFGSTSRR